MVSIATWAFLVAISMVGTCTLLYVDAVCLQPNGARAAAYGLAGVVLVSLLWPLSTGTSLRVMAAEVLIRPLHQVNLLTIFPPIGIQWLSILITGLVVIIAIWPHHSEIETLSPKSRIPWLALSAAAVAVLVLTVHSIPFAVPFGTWLPAIVLLPALALIADVKPKTRLALRLIVPIAILQSLHAYPVAGSQRAWATVVVFVPSAIALAAGSNGLSIWRDTPFAIRVVPSRYFVFSPRLL